MHMRESLSILILDEADLLLSYGYDDDISKIASQLPNIFQAMLMSATLSDDVEKLKSMIMHNPVTVCVNVCMHACMHVCMYVCMYGRYAAGMCECIYVCMHVCIADMLMGATLSDDVEKLNSMIMHNPVTVCVNVCMYACMHVYIADMLMSAALSDDVEKLKSMIMHIALSLYV